MGRQKKIKVMIGNIFQIKLPNGRYAFGRVYRDDSVAIYKKLGDTPKDYPIGSRDFLFNIGFPEEELNNGHCPVVGNDPFKDIEDAWPPPVYFHNNFTDSYSILYKGKVWESTKDECDGFEDVKILQLNEVVDKIMKLETV